MVAIVVATSCLEKYPGSAIQTEKAMKTYDDAVQINTGIYALLKSSSLYTGYLTLLPDIQTDLVYAINGYSNQFGSFWLWQLRSTTSEVESVYAALYSVISNCNFFLENIDEVKANTIDDAKLSDLDYFTGEVYAMRAMAYSELIKLFCKAYDPAIADEAESGVVLRKYYSVKEEAKRASLYDSYQFVLGDLAKAEELLDEEYDGYSAIYTTKAMVQALHARVALYMQDWEKAIEYSTKLIDSDKFKLSSVNRTVGTQNEYQYLWTNDDGYETIWRIYLTPESYGGILGSPFLGFNNDKRYYYPDYVPAQWVLNLYESSDLRYNAYFANLTTGHSHGLTWPLLIKYMGNPTFINSLNLYEVNMPKPFRLAEQYLIRA